MITRDTLVKYSSWFSFAVFMMYFYGPIQSMQSLAIIAAVALGSEFLSGKRKSRKGLFYTSLMLTVVILSVGLVHGLLIGVSVGNIISTFWEWAITSISSSDALLYLLNVSALSIVINNSQYPNDIENQNKAIVEEIDISRLIDANRESEYIDTPSNQAKERKRVQG